MKTTGYLIPYTMLFLKVGPYLGLDIIEPGLVTNYDPSHPEQNWHWSQGLEIKRIMAKYLPEVLLD